jgi:hypothetical protein
VSVVRVSPRSLFPFAAPHRRPPSDDLKASSH